MHLGGLIRHLIHRQRYEITEHDVNNRTHPGHGCADRQSCESRLRNRRIHHSVLAEFFH